MSGHAGEDFRTLLFEFASVRSSQFNGKTRYIIGIAGF
jgi:hypothetical protein